MITHVRGGDKVGEGGGGLARDGDGGLDHLVVGLERGGQLVAQLLGHVAGDGGRRLVRLGFCFSFFNDGVRRGKLLLDTRSRKKKKHSRVCKQRADSWYMSLLAYCFKFPYLVDDLAADLGALGDDGRGALHHVLDDGRGLLERALHDGDGGLDQRPARLDGRGEGGHHGVHGILADDGGGLLGEGGAGREDGGGGQGGQDWGGSCIMWRWGRKR
jgi:hypothetical protein